MPKSDPFFRQTGTCSSYVSRQSCTDCLFFPTLIPYNLRFILIKHLRLLLFFIFVLCKKDAGGKSDILFAVNLCLFAALLINNTFERFAIEMMQFICYPATIIRLCVYPETDPPLLLHSIYLRWRMPCRLHRLQMW